MKEYLETAEAVAAKLKTDERDGLSESEAASRLAEHGENKLREKKKTPLPFCLSIKKQLLFGKRNHIAH